MTPKNLFEQKKKENEKVAILDYFVLSKTETKS